MDKKLKELHKWKNKDELTDGEFSRMIVKYSRMMCMIVKYSRMIVKYR